MVTRMGREGDEVFMFLAPPCWAFALPLGIVEMKLTRKLLSFSLSVYGGNMHRGIMNECLEANGSASHFLRAWLAENFVSAISNAFLT